MKIQTNMNNLLGESLYKRDLLTEYRQRILHLFPIQLKEDVERVIDVMPLEEEIYIESFGSKYKIENAIHSESIVIILQNEEITLTGRIFFNEPNVQIESQLTETQKQILNCIYCRHFDGYIREKRLRNLILIDHFWVLPFKLQLLGEFVIEILDELNKHITEENASHFKRLILENKKYWLQTKSRMVSWWDADYRFPNHKKLNDYIGTKIMKRINRAKV